MKYLPSAGVGKKSCPDLLRIFALLSALASLLEMLKETHGFHFLHRRKGHTQALQDGWTPYSKRSPLR